jgi:hypothetical protein
VLKKYTSDLNGDEQLVPVFQVGQHRQGLRGQLVGAGAEHVGDLAFVDEHRHLRFAHHQLAAVLDLLVGHRIAPCQHAVGVLVPLQYVDKLLLDKAADTHDGPRLRNAGAVDDADGNGDGAQQAAKGCVVGFDLVLRHVQQRVVMA